MSIYDFTIREFLSEGVILVRSSSVTRSYPATILWVQGTRPQRVHRNCALCGKDCYGQKTYRPFGNPAYRYERICMSCVEAAKARAA